MAQGRRIALPEVVRLSALLACAVFLIGFGSAPSTGANVDAAQDLSDRAIAQRILDDQDLRDVLTRAKSVLGTGFNAGNGYAQVWIRDLNTFIELSCEVNDPAVVKENLLRLLTFQGEDGNIPDGFQKNNDVYTAYKNTVETDQESSLVQATYKYIRKTGDASVLSVTVNGVTVRERLGLALEFLKKNRFSEQYGLLWGATTVDWGDVQPEDDPGVLLDGNTHKAIDIYDNSMFLIAVSDYLSFIKNDRRQVARWRKLYATVQKNCRTYLWDRKASKFIPHIYLDGSPFPAGFDENAIHYHGGTTLAIEAGLLSKKEIVASLSHMIENVQSCGAASIGLTVYPPYPRGFFRNPIMSPYSYQNGGDWTWFGGRTIQELIKHDLIGEAYHEIKPMVERVQRDNGFYEWYTTDNRPMGSGTYRGAAGVLGRAIEMLLSWAGKHAHAPPALETRGKLAVLKH